MFATKKKFIYIYNKNKGLPGAIQPKPEPPNRISHVAQS
jgi:hypothetical protein